LCTSLGQWPSSVLLYSSFFIPIAVA
jgi:hypothetical protein